MYYPHIGFIVFENKKQCLLLLSVMINIIKLLYMCLTRDANMIGYHIEISRRLRLFNIPWHSLFYFCFFPFFSLFIFSQIPTNYKHKIKQNE
jgi:hypothetical protein